MTAKFDLDVSSPQMHPLGYPSKIANLPSGHYYRYVDIHPPQGTKTIVTALVLHGFPDSAYGWRHQVKGWSRRGMRLIVPDAIGYTGSSQPLNAEEYNMKIQSDNLEALVHLAGLPEEEKIIIIGHNWGAVVAQRLSQFKPYLVKGVVNLGLHFTVPPQQYVPLEEHVRAFPTFEYQLFFASPEAAALIDSNLEKFMHLMHVTANQHTSGQVPPYEKAGVIEAYLKDSTKSVISGYLSEEEFDTMISEIKRGVGAMINHYQVRDINFPLLKDFPREYLPDMPKLLVLPAEDPILPLSLSANAENEFKKLEVVRLEGPCGHWLQLEKPAEVEKVIGEWVEKQAAKGWDCVRLRNCLKAAAH
ncbi:alpha/beta-hydrolase [Ceratobasidium sp. AG-I]|nr:alpha/beta-hydrolase [Ceratobasidium sp. AG-I]